MFIWPIPGPITRNFAYKSDIYVGSQHAAVDIAAPMGTPIRAIAAGNIEGIGWDQLSGYFVGISHDNDWRSFYRHLSGQAPGAVGKRIDQGQVIGYVGSTGYSLGPHLHFDLWNVVKQDGTAFLKHNTWAHDPELYLGQEDEMDQELADMIRNIDARTAEGIPDLIEHLHVHHQANRDRLTNIKIVVDVILKTLEESDPSGATAQQVADEIARRMQE